MDPHSQILTSDHIDLLVSAAAAWQVLAAPSSSVLSAGSPSLVTLDATEAGRRLQSANIGSLLRQRSTTREDRAHIAAGPDLYEFRRVDDLVAVEVIKAAHAAQHLCAGALHWETSEAARLLDAITVAASQRLPGYAAAPYHWTRPATRTGRPVAIGVSWKPPVPGVTWIEPSAAPEVWNSASLIVITSEALAELPAGMPARSGVFTLDPSAPAPAVWDSVSGSPSSALLFWPTCREWLAEQTEAPAPEYVQYRPA